MARKFSLQEKEKIQQKLITIAIQEWQKMSYSKINVASLCQKVGISTGAFYLFYPSKEHLFYYTVEYIWKNFIDDFEKIMEEKPNKEGFADAMKLVIAKTCQLQGYLKNLINDVFIIMRKLPNDYKIKAFQTDYYFYESIIKKYHLKPKKKIEDIVAIFTLIASGFLLDEVANFDIVKTVEIIIDLIIDGIFY